MAQVGPLFEARCRPQRHPLRGCSDGHCRYKKSSTDLENQLKQAIEKGKITEQEVANQKDKLANMEAECQRELKQAKDEYVALKATVPDTEKLRGSYEGRISELEGQLREAQKQIGLRDLEISRLTGEAEVVSWITKLLQCIKDR